MNLAWASWSSILEPEVPCRGTVPAAGTRVWQPCLVVTYDEARQAAERHLHQAGSGSYVITGDQEFDVGWVFFYDSRQHLLSGDVRDALAGNAPVLIDRISGQVCPTGTAWPVEEYVAEYTAQKRQGERWPGPLDSRFLALLALVRDGMGRRDARRLDLLVSVRHRPRDGWTLLDELTELERRGLVRQADDGIGHRWSVTDAGVDILITTE